MKSISRLHLITSGMMLCGIAVLGLDNLWMFHNPVDISADLIVARRYPTAKSDGMPGPNLQETLEVAAIVARPLFSPDRRADRPKAKTDAPEIQPGSLATAASATARKKPAIRFQGTSQTDGKMTALIGNEDGSDPNWVKVGQTVGTWTILSIDHGRIVLTYDNDKVVYSLYPDGSDHGEQ